MPTGYTAPVVDGKIDDLPSYAWRCARAFGARRNELVFPDRSDGSIQYHMEGLEKAQVQLTFWKELSSDEVLVKMTETNDEARAENSKYLQVRATELERINAMLGKVEDWDPPTEDHVNLKKFMIEQLNLSKPPGEPILTPLFEDPEKFRQLRIDRTEQDLKYHTKYLEEEKKLAAGRYEWAKQLEDSLENL